MRMVRTAVLASLLPAAALGSLGAGPARAGDGAADPLPGLTVAILDLAEAPGLVPPQEEARRPSWRTSFGSERQSEPKPKATGAAPLPQLADVDVVLIQGARAAAPLRRLFPPRAWRLVVSRRILAPRADGGDAASVPPFATAIAVRARPDIRVTAREPGLRLVRPEATPLADPLVAATAVRILARGRVVWLASVALPSDCHPGSAPCPAEAGLAAWRTSKRDYSATTLVGGRLAAAAGRDDPQARCAAHRIESDLEAEPVPAPAAASAQDGSGCISIVRLPGAAPGLPAPSAAAADDVANGASAP